MRAYSDPGERAPGSSAPGHGSSDRAPFFYFGFWIFDFGLDNSDMRLGLGIHVALVEGARAIRRRLRQLASRPWRPRQVARLHVGSGPLVREGWTNIDMDRFPGVDYVMDVRGGLPFEDVQHIYAEHFIEHLSFDDAMPRASITITCGSSSLSR